MTVQFDRQRESRLNSHKFNNHVTGHYREARSKQTSITTLKLEVNRAEETLVYRDNCVQRQLASDTGAQKTSVLCYS